MKATEQDSQRAETDASLRAERDNADRVLARRVVAADDDADAVLQLARQRADRVLQAARAAADALLPLGEQTRAAAALLLEQRQTEDRTVATERERADEVVVAEREQRRKMLLAQLVLERQATDLHLALERSTADSAVTSRDDFLAQASHDLRGLMAAQKIYLSLLAKEAGGQSDDGPLVAHVAILLKIDAQMDRLISDLVDVVAIQAGKLAVSLEARAAQELLSTGIAVFEPLARERGQSLSMIPAPADVSIRVDLARGVQVLGNLLSNAIKFTQHGGEIRVGFEAGDDEVMFFVADNGPGIPPERAEQIFERFVGSSNSSSGLGLGLFIAAQLVKAHEGRLWFDRDRAAGSVFRFTLPRA